MILQGYCIAFGYALVCIALGFLARRLGLPKPYTRKMIHVTVGAEWVILYHFMGVSIHFLIVCLACFAFLFVSYRLGWFSSTMGSDGDNAPGTVYYALSMSLMAAVTLLDPVFLLPFGIAVACTSFGDGAAGIIGQAVRRGNPKIYRKKTLFGTLSIALICAVCAFGFSLYFSMDLSVWACLCIGLLSAGVELLSTKGLDNILVPLASAALSYAYLRLPWIDAYVLSIALTPFIIAFAIEKRALTRGGIVAAILLDAVLTVTLGNGGFIVLCLFFSLGVLCDKIRKRKKQAILASKEEKGSCRDSVQVLANAAVAALMACLYACTKHTAFIAAFIAAMAEALGDTVASGIGVLAKGAYDPFRRRACERGMSGGMSVLGTSASLIACVALSLVGCGLFSLPLWQAACIGAIAFFGTAVDSLLGSLCQLKYRCAVCGCVTERREHCEQPTVHTEGFRPFNNDFVNLSSTFVSAVVTVVVFLFI